MKEVTDILPKTETRQIQKPAQRLAQIPMSIEENYLFYL